jgi:large subunit ribosomal protein L30
MTAKKTNTGSGKIHLKWVRSAICAPVKQKRVIKGLGFTRLNQVIERPDTNAIRDGGEGSASGGVCGIVQRFKGSEFQGFTDM